jgi:von Willebrand factor type A domain
MAWKALLSGGGDWLRDTNAMLVSACCHFSMLIAVALVSVTAPGGGVGTKLVVSLGKGDESPVADDSPLGGDSQIEERSPLQAEHQIEAALGPANAMDPAPLFTTAAIATKPEIDVGPLALPMSPAATSGLIAGLATSGGSGESDGLGPGSGKGLGGGRGGEGSSGKAATEFFGIGGYGQSFVYVVDCSGSMNENGKFERARYELLQSIEQLNKDQSYFVIFYNHEAHPMQGNRLVLATPARISETTRWINYAEAQGGTNPLPSLLYALSMHPDAIYFLSDGQFDPNTIPEVRLRNRPNNRLKTRQIPIHTIAFFDRYAAGLMRTIARNSGGEFKFVQ